MTVDYDDELLESWLALEASSVYDKSTLDAAKKYALAFAKIQIERVAQEEHESGSYTVAKRLRERVARLEELK
jgi:hypothetical protein